MRSLVKKIMVLGITICLVPVCTVKAVTGNSSGEEKMYTLNENTYLEYIEKHKDKKLSDKEILIPMQAFKKDDNANVSIKKSYIGTNSPVIEWSNDVGEITWKFNVEKSGLYNIEMKYMAIEGKGGDIERGIKIDGEYPFKEANNISFRRVWKNRDSEIQKDNQGNQIRPNQVEEKIWQVEDFKDQEGLYREPYKIFLEEGEHEITLIGIKEPIAIEYIKFYEYKNPASFAEVKADYDKNGYKSASESVKVQGEDAIYKSSPTLYPSQERSDMYTEPYDIDKITFNMIGGNNWRHNGQWITWKFNVPEDGLYEIAMRYKQDYLMGIPASRKIYIDGQVPFEEASVMEFNYSTDWQIDKLNNKDGEACYVYLTAGEHEITLENTLGEMSERIQRVASVSKEMLDLYGKIIMITSASPDTFRDYDLEKRIPGIEDKLLEMSEILKEEVEILKSMSKDGASEAHVLERTSIQLKEMAEKPNTIHERLSAFRDGQASLSTWVQSMKEQPINLDYIEFTPLNEEVGNAKPGFFEKTANALKSFGLSFVKDYSKIGNTYEDGEAIDVWVMLGRDQADTLKAMIDDDFTPKYGIKVNLNILNSESTLLFAASSGKAPDVAVNVSQTLAVDYGVRGALADLGGMEGFNGVRSRFKDTSLVPLQYEGKIYGLPMTQSFPVMFYRKDILQNLGIKPPETWEEVYDVIATLQENNLEFGAGGTAAAAGGGTTAAAGTTINTALFDTLLLQNGGEYYSDDRTICTLDSNEGIKSFQEFCGLYSDYGLPLYFDFYNRFRTGEMPIGIVDYSMYNQLTVAAPEIKGMWDIAPIPGTQNGSSIDRSVAGACTANIMFESSDNKEGAWNFLEWWTSTETQVRYGRELEAIIGSGARYNTANVEAIQYFPWNASEYAILSEQLDHVNNIPVIPGSYYTTRHLNNAFREVESLGELPRDSLVKYVEEINKEILKKREEFGLD